MSPPPFVVTNRGTLKVTHLFGLEQWTVESGHCPSEGVSVLEGGE